ncbi:kinase-like domain-containing protein [Elsinoe ampelina]|uniref:Kinase-like domain-containing protein n=1 Tax=Elsinoe ampelina TaxID=302913 RepID=A0A6A6GMQ2_9PEZI|nr:kinase-like domain-containing protein [Elsinoe ampelina]
MGLSDAAQTTIIRATRCPKEELSLFGGETSAEAVRTIGGVVIFRKYGDKDDLEKKQAIQQEIDIMRNLSHPNIVSLFEGPVPEDIEAPVLALEFLDGMSLDKFSTDKVSTLPPLLVHRLLRTVPSVLVYMLEQEIEHNDIRIENIVLCTQGFKLIDFGLARRGADRYVWRDGVSRYAPPELQKRSEALVYGARDVMAFGIIIFWALRWMNTPMGESWIVSQAIDPGPEHDDMATWLAHVRSSSIELPSSLNQLTGLFEEKPELRMTAVTLDQIAQKVEKACIPAAIEMGELVRANYEW